LGSGIECIELDDGRLSGTYVPYIYIDVTSPGPAELETGESGTRKVTVLGHDSSWEAGKKSELEGRMTRPAMAELGPPPPLSEEYAELERRRRAVELQVQSMGAVRAAELQGHTHPRAELEALRANARVVHGRTGHFVRSSACLSAIDRKTDLICDDIPMLHLCLSFES
jgi:hypothetical protein